MLVCYCFGNSFFFLLLVIIWSTITLLKKGSHLNCTCLMGVLCNDRLFDEQTDVGRLADSQC